MPENTKTTSRAYRSFVVWFLFFFWSATAVAVTWPASAPSGETVWGKFTALFQKVLVDANPATSDGTVKRAISLSQSCPSGQAIQGFSSTGAIICSAAGWSSGGSPAPSAPITTTVPMPATDTGTLGTITTTISDFNGGELPFEMKPRCDLDPAVYNSARNLCYAKRLGWKTFVKHYVLDGWGQQWIFTTVVKFSADGMYAWDETFRTPARATESAYHGIRTISIPYIYSSVTSSKIVAAVRSLWYVVQPNNFMGYMNGSHVQSYPGTNYAFQIVAPHIDRLILTGNKVTYNYYWTFLSPWISSSYYNGPMVWLPKSPIYCYNPEIANSYDESQEIVGKYLRHTSPFGIKWDPFADNLKVFVQPDVLSAGAEVALKSRDVFVTTDHVVCSDTLQDDSVLPISIPPVPTTSP